MGANHVAIARSYGFGESKRFIAILEKLLNEDEAKIVVSLPSGTSNLAKNLGISEEKIEPLLRRLLSKGAVFKSSIGYKGANDVICLVARELYGWGVECPNHLFELV